MNFYNSVAHRAVFVLCACVVMLGLQGCRDEVDESDMYTFTGQLVSDFLEDIDELSYFSYMTKLAKVSSKSESNVATLLSTRGNYTCFAPTNDAIQAYLDSVYSTEGYNYLDTPDSTADNIVLNCIIDNGDENCYMVEDMEVGTFSTSTFADRKLTIRFDTIDGGSLAIYVNTYSRIISDDNEVENGVVHVIDRVITPSNSTVPSLIAEAGNLKIFARLLEITEWDEQMTEWRDYDYEETNPGEGPDCPTESSGNVPTPDHRDTGYTAFVESDSVLIAGMGLPELQLGESGVIENWDEVYEVIAAKCLEYYPDATDTDPTSEDNAVNQFVSYHLVNVGVTYDHIVIHYNEMGFSYTNRTQLTLDAWEYYETMGKNHWIFKVTEGSQTDGMRINRYVSERNANYSYDLSNVEIEGILINEDNGSYDIAALNGYYYVINDILVYTDDVPNKVLNERMRYDLTALLPEQITNGFRRIYTSEATNMYIPSGYFDYMTWNDESNVDYLPGYARTFLNYQGDEYNIQGQYDVIIRMPRVPSAGTYEIRIGLSNNTARSMCQIYFGTNKDNLPATGLPLDERKDGTDADIGWEADTSDSDANDENDKMMRNHHYMKSPNYFGPASSAGVTKSCRVYSNVLRYIAYTGYLDPANEYYMRMKSVLENTAAQLFLDYFEIVPKGVYSNPLKSEDKW